jgi:hypothetical protein
VTPDVGTIKEEEVDLTEYEDLPDAWRQLGRFLDQVYKHQADSLGVGLPDPERIRATMVG